MSDPDSDPVLTSHSEPVRGVVLAGGESSRFGAAGEDKALARVGSERALARVVRVLRAATGRRPVVVVRDRDRRERYASIVGGGATFAFDAPGHEGPLAGLFGAAAATDARWLFCCACDMPLLDARAVGWLADRTSTVGARVDAVAVEYPDGALEPLHAVYRRASVAARRGELPAAAGPRALLSELAERDAVESVPLADAPADVRLDRSLTNVNTVAELEAALEGDGES